MNSSKDRKQNSAIPPQPLVEEARHFAHQVAEFLSTAVRVACAENQSFGGRLTLADVLRVGAFFTKLMLSLKPTAQQVLTPEDEQLFSVLIARPFDREKLEELIVNRAISGADNLAELRAAMLQITEFLSRRVDFRRFIMQAIKETLPPGAPGRKAKIRPAQLPKLLARAEQLRPAMEALVGARQISRNRTLAERITFIEADYPQECAYLSAHLAAVEQVFTDEKLLRQVATLKSGVRLLADALAGAEFGISPRYSIQLVRQARRATQKRKRTGGQQKI